MIYFFFFLCICEYNLKLYFYQDFSRLSKIIEIVCVILIWASHSRCKRIFATCQLLSFGYNKFRDDDP